MRVWMSLVLVGGKGEWVGPSLTVYDSDADLCPRMMMMIMHLCRRRFALPGLLSVDRQCPPRVFQQVRSPQVLQCLFVGLVLV